MATAFGAHVQSAHSSVGQHPQHTQRLPCGWLGHRPRACGAIRRQRIAVARVLARVFAYNMQSAGQSQYTQPQHSCTIPVCMHTHRCACCFTLPPSGPGNSLPGSPSTPVARALPAGPFDLCAKGVRYNATSRPAPALFPLAQNDQRARVLRERLLSFARSRSGPQCACTGASAEP